MTAGGIIVLVQPAQSSTYYPADYIDVSRFEAVPNIAGDGYGYVSEWEIGAGGSAKLVASSDFVGDLTAYIGVRS
jgi:hypothetical protein